MKSLEKAIARKVRPGMKIRIFANPVENF